MSEFFEARAPLSEVPALLPAHSTPDPGTGLIVPGISQRGFRIHHNRLANELVATAGLVSWDISVWREFSEREREDTQFWIEYRAPKRKVTH